jgi:hypothetical protein
MRRLLFIVVMVGTLCRPLPLATPAAADEVRSAASPPADTSGVLRRNSEVARGMRRALTAAPVPEELP